MDQAMAAMQAAGIKGGPAHLRNGNSVFNNRKKEAEKMINIQQNVKNNS